MPAQEGDEGLEGGSPHSQAVSGIGGQASGELPEGSVHRRLRRGGSVGALYAISPLDFFKSVSDGDTTLLLDRHSYTGGERSCENASLSRSWVSAVPDGSAAFVAALLPVSCQCVAPVPCVAWWMPGMVPRKGHRVLCCCCQQRAACRRTTCGTRRSWQSEGPYMAAAPTAQVQCLLHAGGQFRLCVVAVCPCTAVVCSRGCQLHAIDEYNMTAK